MRGRLFNTMARSFAALRITTDCAEEAIPKLRLRLPPRLLVSGEEISNLAMRFPRGGSFWPHHTDKSQYRELMGKIV